MAGTTEGVNMAEEQASPAGPDLAQGIAPNDFTGETLLGHVGDRDVLLVRSGSEIFAVDAHCSHYHGPLAEGLVAGGSLPFPWRFPRSRSGKSSTRAIASSSGKNANNQSRAATAP